MNKSERELVKDIKHLAGKKPVATYRDGEYKAYVECRGKSIEAWGDSRIDSFVNLLHECMEYMSTIQREPKDKRVSEKQFLL